MSKFKEIIDETYKICAGEDENKYLLLSALGTFYVKNLPGGYPLHILVGGVSRGGKDQLVKSFIYQANGNYKKNAHMTAKSIIYDITIKDYSNIILYIPDISASTLDDSSMANIMTEGTSATVTNPNTLRSRHYPDRGIPFLIATTTRSFKREDVLNRYLPLTIDESREQTRRVINKIKEIALVKIKLKQNLSKFKKKKVNIKFIDRLLDNFPDYHIIFREKSQQMIKLLMGIASINHQKEKEPINIDEIDYNIFEKVVFSFGKQALMGISTSQRKHYELIKSITSDNKLKPTYRDFTAQEIIDHKDYLYEHATFYNILKELRKRRLVICTGREQPNSEFDRGRKKALFRLVDVCTFEVPKWKELIK